MAKPIPYIATITWPRWRCERMDGVRRVVEVRAERGPRARLKAAQMHGGRPAAWKAERIGG